MRKTIPIFIFAIFCTLIIGCESLKTTTLIPMPDPEATILPQTNSVTYIKNGIIAIAVPLNDVKEVDAFGVVIVNRTEHSITLTEKDCWLLDLSGNEIKSLDKSQKSFYLGKNFKPKFPSQFSSEVFKWDRSIKASGRGFAAISDGKADKTVIMPDRRKQFFLYFKKQSTKSSKIRLIIPKIHHDYTGKDTTFVFKFKVEKS